jgi:hypothetical protein
MELTVIRYNQNPNDVKRDQIILQICKQIRIAMSKEMRIFCIDLITKVIGITNQIIE